VSILQAIVLGAVQGLTEFIPISSSGHLVIVPELFGWDSPGLAFDVLLHVASLGALFIYFRAELLDLVKGVIGREPASQRLALLLLIGSIPAGIAGLALGGFFERQFEDAPQAALQLLLTAVILVAAEQLVARRKAKLPPQVDASKSSENLTITDSLLVGGAQALAILPGISRSGSTISMGLALGLERQDAARFAFLLAIPALIGAAFVKIPDLDAGGMGTGAAAAGFVASLITSYIAVAALIRFLKNNTLYPFAAYCAVAGVVFYLVLR
jgi:undecaprenyl-diphosphatase